jgi:hypothetical protein
LAFLNLHGQSTSTLSGAQAQGLGNATSCLFNEWAILNNVGGLATLEVPTAAITYAVNSSLPNGNSQAIAMSIPFKSIVTSIGAHSFGDQVYREQVISAGVGNKFGLAALGIKLNYIQYRAMGFGQKGMLTVSLGGIAEITPAFFIGAHIININQPIISDQEDERVPTKLVVGIRYDLSNKIMVTAELEKDIAFSPTSKMGIAYTPNKKITFRTGFNLHPNAAFFGIGFNHKRILLDYAFEYRMELGVSNQASLGYQFSKK